MARLLILHHTPSPHLDTMLDAVRSGASAPDVGGVTVQLRPALSVGAADVLEADGIVLGTPANLGYMSGALKHAFDVIYYPCLHHTRGRPYGLYVHGNEGLEGAVSSVVKVVSGLGWRRAVADVLVLGAPTKADLERCWELGASLAAQLS